MKNKKKKRFKNTFTFSNKDINKFILLLRKDVYPYDDMDERVNFSKASLPENEGYGGYYRCRLHACKKSF